MSDEKYLPGFAVVIATYKRAQLLKLLINDLLGQTWLPNTLIIVDGDPKSSDVSETLSTLDSRYSVPTVYVPSNHSNLAYQRYLGWRTAASAGADILIYFDDDQRIYQHDVLEWLAKPLREDNDIVGVGCYSRVPDRDRDPAMRHVVARKDTPWIVKQFGSQKILKLKPGQLTPVGHRVRLVDDGHDYVETKWLQGRIMAYRMSAISRETFSEDLFALYEFRIGRAEDTFLSRRVGARGKLLYTFRAVVDHPHADTPKAYPYEAYKYAYAATYSRRFLNDYSRVYAAPTASDRWALIKSYAGNTLLSWMQAARKPTKTHFALARGTTLGTIHGLTRSPTAKRLTPDIDWWGDAEEALKHIKVLNHAAG